ncbi:hypothetical protein [Chamaesiphon sp. VAR_48_metabat_135_sub]|uniref:hypothetical protein n=1 Tax=Chamaesiphon sp. VAR_48_metabat_135_sub TaxID=2964699 RepID=UPI00286D098B|nr:hypothetical protein [Chamaesiphon sp. VAR_48_metabat_135_sub]
MSDRTVTGTIDKNGFVTFDEEVTIAEPQAVTIIFKTGIEASKPLKNQQELTDKIIQGLHEAITGKTVALSALWDELDAD